MPKKYSIKSSRKSSRKSLRKNSRKSLKKSSRKSLRKSSRKSSRKSLRGGVRLPPDNVRARLMRPAPAPAPEPEEEEEVPNPCSVRPQGLTLDEQTGNIWKCDQCEEDERITDLITLSSIPTGNGYCWASDDAAGGVCSDSNSINNILQSSSVNHPYRSGPQNVITGPRLTSLRNVIRNGASTSKCSAPGDGALSRFGSGDSSSSDEPYDPGMVRRYLEPIQQPVPPPPPPAQQINHRFLGHPDTENPGVTGYLYNAVFGRRQQQPVYGGPPLRFVRPEDGYQYTKQIIEGGYYLYRDGVTGDQIPNPVRWRYAGIGRNGLRFYQRIFTGFAGSRQNYLDQNGNLSERPP